MTGACACQGLPYCVRDLLIESTYGSKPHLLIESTYGSKPHRVSCGQWSTPGEVRQVLNEHSQVVKQIESINPGFTVVDINTLSCPGRAGIRILYATASDRQAIELMLGEGQYFFGVPYQKSNT